MQVIHRSLDGVALPDIKACDHIERESERGVSISRYLAQAKQCANCGGYMCADCEDDAVICHACPGAICWTCQETARKRKHTTGPESPARVVDGLDFVWEYLCNPCRDKQDAAKRLLIGLAIGMDWVHHTWLDELVDRLESAIEKAKEALL